MKGDLATRQSIALVRLFKAMKDYIQNDPLLIESTNLARLSLQVSDNAKDISKIKETMVTKDDLSKIIQSFSLPDKGLEYVIYAGQTFEADAAYADIYSKAKQKLYVVDNYIGPKTLLMLKSIPANVDIIVFSDNIKNMLRLTVTDRLSCPRIALPSCPPTAQLTVRGRACFAGRVNLPVFLSNTPDNH